MSMRNYAVRYYGFLVKPEELNLQAIVEHYQMDLQKDFGGDKEQVFDWLREEQKTIGGDGDLISRWLLTGYDMEGDFTDIITGDEKCSEFWQDDWFLLELPKYPSFFIAHYKTYQDLLNQSREAYGTFLCADFDWDARFVRLDGVIYG